MKGSVLLFGGSSDEKLVSVATAQNLASRFIFEELLFMDVSGAISKVAQAELLAHQRPFEVQFKPSQKPFLSSVQESVSHLHGKTVFLGLHGTEGEDGTIQALLEKSKIAFTGSGAQASRLCFDKIKTKERVSTVGVPLAPQLLIHKKEPQEIAKTLTVFYNQQGPLVVKPVSSGSSFGLHILKSSDRIHETAIAIAQSPYDCFMAEKLIEGRELTVGVLVLNGSLHALPPSEVVTEKGHAFDYLGKYLGKGTKEITPAQLTPTEKFAAQKTALDAHKALGCYGYTRTDMILTDSGPVFLETNTLPGLSKASFIPQQLEADGIPMSIFVEEQLTLAQKRNKI